MAYVEFSHEVKSNRMASMHVHPCHELYYLAKGKTKYIIGEEIYPVEAGNLVFVPRGYYHITDYGDCELIERSLIYFDDGLFDKDTQPILDELMEMRLISIPISRVEGLEALLDSLERAMSIDGAFGDAVRKVHALAVLSFVCRHRREFVPVLSEADAIVHRVSEYVSTHYGDDLSLGSLSRRFSVSEGHLSRRFKEVSGVGLNEYITFVRIINAERLLRSGERSITLVAQQCGFNDSNYFSTVFKKIKGITPLKFAKTEMA